MKIWIARYRRRLWIFFPGMKSPNRYFTADFFDSMQFLIFYTVNSIDHDRVVSSGRPVSDIVHVSVYL